MNVAFACVAERTETWFERAFKLSLSIRRFGGTLADAPIVVNVVDGVDPWFVRGLAPLDVDVRVVERVDPTYPYANKLRMLQLDDPVDVLIALDCDTVVVGDPSPLVSSEGVGAKPADCDFLHPKQWRRLFRMLSLPEPRREFWTTTFGQRTYPYFNSGVLVLPRAWRSALFESWLSFIYRLQEVFAAYPDIAEYRAYTDQFALTCALVEVGAPLRSLPVQGNFPTHLNVHPARWDASRPPQVVHYHSRMDARGFLAPTRYPIVNMALDRFNRARADATGIPYRGLPSFGVGRRVMQDLRSGRWFHRPGSRAARRAVGRALSAIGVRDGS